MRKITKEIAAAFASRRPRTVGNTSTDGTAVFLHGNRIVERREDGVWATLAGWNTPTTRERVNGVTGACFHQKARSAMLNGQPVDPTAWIKVA